MSTPATVSLSELRQDPIEVLRRVKDEGAEYVLTDHGIPAARIIPLARGPWVGESVMRRAFRTPVDRGWRRELDEQRAQAEVHDPFER